MKSKKELPKPFRGIVTPMITPLKDIESIDKDKLKKTINRLINSGIHGLFILGTTGEGVSLSYKLKNELINETCKYVDGRIPVFVGITDSSFMESLSLAKTAEMAGAGALVAAPPFYFNLDQQEIVTYFRKLADRLPLPLFIYNIPAQTKIMIEPETVRLLATHPRIIGIKDSSGNAPYFNTLLFLMKGDKTFSIFVGPDEMLASSVLLGGHGGVNSGSNLFPELFVGLYYAAKSGNLKLVSRLQDEVMLLSSKIYQTEKCNTSFLKSLKTAMSISGLSDEYILPPLFPYQEKQIEKIKNNLAEIKKIMHDKV